MKREFGFTQARFRYQSVMPTRSIQNPARPKPREVTHATPNSPACGGSPLLIPPRAGERKGAVMLSVHLECDAQAQSAVEAELVSEHPLTFNTVTQSGEAGCQ